MEPTSRPTSRKSPVVHPVFTIRRQRSGSGDAYPIFPGKRYLDWDLEDPSGTSLEEVRSIRDEIDRRVHEMLGEVVGKEGSTM